MKIIFFGTSSVALPVLEALSKTHEVLAVVTMPDAKVGRKQETKQSEIASLADKLGLKVIKSSSLKGQAVSDELKAFAADVFVVASYGQIVPKEILEIPPLGSLNVHPSLLPKYRGPTPFQTALLNGDTETGTTIMLMDEQLDHGPIVAQEEVKIESYDTSLTLSERLGTVSGQLLLKVLDNVPFSFTVQDDSQATFSKILSKEDGKIDWNKSAQEIYNQFRAYFMWPGVWTTWNGKVLKLTDVEPRTPLGQGTSSAQGESLGAGMVTNDGVVVCGQNTFIKIKTLQLEGRNEVSISDFLNGYKEFVGSRLG